MTDDRTQSGGAERVCTLRWRTPAGSASSMPSGSGTSLRAMLQHELGMTSNLLAHHLRTLEDAGLLTRRRSEADRRRSYLHLDTAVLADLLPRAEPAADRSPGGVRVHREHRPVSAGRCPVGASQPRARRPPRAPTPPTPSLRVRPPRRGRHGLKLTRGQAAPPGGRPRGSATTSSPSATTPTKSSTRPHRDPSGRRRHRAALHWSVPRPRARSARPGPSTTPTTTSPAASHASRRAWPPPRPDQAGAAGHRHPSSTQPPSHLEQR